MNGQIQIGPLPFDNVRAMRHAMTENNLHLGARNGSELDFTMDNSGMTIIVSGRGVKGYLVDSEGLEASESDIENFSRNYMPKGSALTILGHHYLSETSLVLCRTGVARDFCGNAQVNMERSLFKAKIGAVDLSSRSADVHTENMTSPA